MSARRMQILWVIDVISDWVANFSILGLLIMTAIVTVEVIARYVFRNSIDWVDEIASYLFLMMIFCGLSHTLKEGGHIQITVISDLLPEKIKNVLKVAGYILGIIFTILFAIACVSRFATYWIRNVTAPSTLYTPLFIPAIVMVVGSILFSLQMICEAIRCVFNLSKR